jgi:ribosomal protein S18
VKFLSIFFLFTFSILSQGMYEIKKKNEKPIIVEVKSMDAKTIVFEKDSKTIELNFKDIDYVKEYIPNADKIYERVLLFPNNTYVNGTIISQTIKKVTIEVDGELHNFKTNTIENIVDTEEFWRERNKSREKAMYYSAMFPSWGQSYGNQGTFKTLVYPIAFFSLFAMGVNSYVKSEKAYDDYQNSFFFNQGAFANHVSLANRSNLLLLSAIGVWGFSVFDAYFFFSPTYTQERLEIKIEKKF